MPPTEQDTLRLLTLLFDYGHFSEMYEALHDGIRSIEIYTWLQVIPQLIARIDTPRPLVSRLIHQVLTDLGKFHPQALVYRDAQRKGLLTGTVTSCLGTFSPQNEVECRMISFPVPNPDGPPFSLTVAAKSKDAARRTAANKILHKIREHSDNLVNQVG